MNIATTKSKAWQKRRSDYNHDWLQNSYYTGELARWKGFIDDTIEGGSFTTERFKSRVAHEWLKNGPEALNLTKEYKQVMSPSALFSEGPLSRTSKETKSWLGPLVTLIWENKYDVDERTEQVDRAYKDADEMFQELSACSHFLDESTPISETEFTARFEAFRKSCQLLGEAIHHLEQSIKVA